MSPRCPTTYAGVSHTQLARDLFREGDDDVLTATGKYVMDDWEGAPESFVCQEQRYRRHVGKIRTTNFLDGSRLARG